MGRTMEKNANRIKVSLYIVKRRLLYVKTGKVPGGVCGRMESGVRMRMRMGRDRLTVEI